MAYSLSVVVPAHDEEAVLGRCLRFVEQMAEGECHTVVAVNGSTDGTVGVAEAVAARRAEVTVLDLPAPGKSGALNAGDAAAGTTFPRVYLDADIEVSAGTLRRLRDVLAASTEPRVAAPRPRFELAGRPWAVRAFYDVFQRLPYATDALVGLGVYAVNQAGHARLGGFPDLIADDLFVQRAFDRDERVLLEEEFVVQTPRTLAALVKVRTRVAAGNAELAEAKQDESRFAGSGGSTLASLGSLVARTPGLLPAAVCYVLVGLLARARARRRVIAWERDTTTRGPQPTPGRVRLDMLEFDPLTYEGVADHVVTELTEGRGGVIVTPNVDIMQKCRSQEVAQLFQRADVAVADGAPVVLASRLAGRPLPARVTGAGLLPVLSEAARDAGRSVYLLGGNPGVADRAARALEDMYPGLKVAGTYCPPFGFETDQEELARIESSVVSAAPDIVFVGLGAPKQERLSYRLAPELPGAWFLGCGAALTMVAGEVQRAPRWVQVAGAEWVHRLVSEPRRLARRYLVDDAPYAVALLARSARTGLRTRRAAR